MSISIYTYSNPYMLQKENFYTSIKNCFHLCASQTLVNGLVNEYSRDFYIGKLTTFNNFLRILYNDWDGNRSVIRQRAAIDHVINFYDFSTHCKGDLDEESLRKSLRMNRTALCQSVRTLFELGVERSEAVPAELSVEQKCMFDIYEELQRNGSTAFSLPAQFTEAEIDHAIDETIKFAVENSNSRAKESANTADIRKDSIVIHALLKNIEWDVSIIDGSDNETIKAAKEEFDDLWNKTLPLERELIDEYKTRLYYSIERWDMDYDIANSEVKPNYMQRRALKELNRIRAMGANKALVCAAAGSGKTILAAFDALNFNPRRLLYIVQEGSILMKSYETFQRIFGSDKSYGVYNAEYKDFDNDFVFSTNITMANSLELFEPHTFDYIIIDAYGIIGLNSKDSTDKGFLKLSPILFSPQKRLMVDLRRKHAQNEDLSAKRSAACHFGSTVSDVVPSRLLQRQSAEHTPDVDLHRSTVRHPKDVSLACAA